MCIITKRLNEEGFHDVNFCCIVCQGCSKSEYLQHLVEYLVYQKSAHGLTSEGLKYNEGLIRLIPTLYDRLQQFLSSFAMRICETQKLIKTVVLFLIYLDQNNLKPMCSTNYSILLFSLYWKYWCVPNKIRNVN